jgi:ATP-dependent 26S proteasome regulatory subunit
VEKFIKAPGSGLIILHGLPGTGKTSYIRHLINTYEKKFVYVTQEIASRLSSPDFISFCFTKLKDSILVLEDCETLLKSRESGNRNTGLSDLLDMTDGLLSDVFNIKFICTFNEDIKNIDKALLRKGRLACKYEFGKLKKEKALKLVERLNADTSKVIGDMSLAEIYNLEDMSFDIESTRTKIGF